MLKMKSHVYSILISALCVSRATGFAGLTESVAPLVENGNALTSSMPVANDFMSHSVSPFLNNANTLAVSVPIVGDLLNSYKHALQVHPLATKMITGGILATMGDAIAQSREPDEPYDKNRAVSFATFDMCYRALQHNVFPIIVAQCKGQALLAAAAAIPPLAKLASQNVDYLAAAEQTLASQLGVVPFLYYPVFFALVSPTMLVCCALLFPWCHVVVVAAVSVTAGSSHSTCTLAISASIYSVSLLFVSTMASLVTQHRFPFLVHSLVLYRRLARSRACL